MQEGYKKYSEVEAKDVEYLWFPYIPKGMVTILQGDPKSGKTFMLIDIISRITRGDKQPLSDLNFNDGCVIFQNNDDPINYTLVPRLKKQGANLDKVMFIDEDKNKLTFKNLNALENAIIVKRPELVIIDPIQAFMGESDINSMVQVRNSLAPLKRLAEEYNCAIVLVQHLKKGNESKAIYKGAGSIDFVGFARSMIMVIKDRETDERLFIHNTSNVSKEGHCLCYKITDDGLAWTRDKGEVNPDEVLQSNNSADKISYAQGFIIGALSKGDLLANDLKEMALKNNITEKNYNITKANLNNNKIFNYQKDKKFYWSLLKKEREDINNE